MGQGVPDAGAFCKQGDLTQGIENRKEHSQVTHAGRSRPTASIPCSLGGDYCCRALQPNCYSQWEECVCVCWGGGIAKDGLLADALTSLFHKYLYP